MYTWGINGANIHLNFLEINQGRAHTVITGSINPLEQHLHVHGLRHREQRTVQLILQQCVRLQAVHVEAQHVCHATARRTAPGHPAPLSSTLPAAG